MTTEDDPEPLRPSPRLIAGSILAGAGLVAVATVLARIAGVGRWFVFSHAVGVTCTGQVYATTNQIPNVMFEIAAGGALAAVVVPLVSGYLNRGDEASADRVASAMLTWTVLIGLPLTIVLAALARPVAGLLLNETGCSGAVRVGAMMLVVFAPQIVLYGVGIVLVGVLQAHRRFLAAALAPLVSSVVVIAVYLGYRHWTAAGFANQSIDQIPQGALWWLAGGTTAGVLALSLPLFLPAHRAGVRWRPTLRFPAGAGRRVGALATAGLVGVGAQQLAVLATIWLANRADGVGVLNVYTYSQTVYLLPYAVLVVPLATVAFPRLTDPDRAVQVLRRTGRAVLVAAILGAALVLTTRREVGEMFWVIDIGSQGAGGQTLAHLPMALAAYAPGLVGFGLTALLTRALYARGSARSAGAYVATGWLIAAALPLITLSLMRTVDPGTTLLVLGLAASLGMTVTAVLLWAAVRRDWTGEVYAGWARVAIAALGGALLAALGRELIALTWTPEGLLGVLIGATGTSLLVLVTVLGMVRVVTPEVFSDLTTGRRASPVASSAATEPPSEDMSDGR